jgi:crotonobetainyl-CoA:carnitine CoA-transferase CaiB-like acyl-CoA transferase
MAEGPLNGVRILDLTQVWAGPLATRFLADLGADVIKVEAPLSRGPAATPGNASWSIFTGGDPGDRPWNRNGLFNKLNRNKRSVSIDLKTQRGREIVLQLVAECDVLIENFSARALPSLGLDYEALRAVQETLIYVAMPGFGLSGPYRDWVSYGPSLEPMSGLASVMGYGPDEPRVTAMGSPDPIGGVAAASAVVNALERRRRTDQGGFIDLAQREAAISMLGEIYVEYQTTGIAPHPTGNRHASVAPQGVYRCSGDDDWISITTRNDADWEAFVAVAGAGWAADSRFRSDADRKRNEDALDAMIDAWTSTQDKFELMAELQAAGVPAGAVLSAPELLADPHLQERGYWTELGSVDAAAATFPGSPIVFDGQRATDWVGSPALGEHNEEVLGGLLGISGDDIQRLYADGVIADRPPS